MTLQESTIDDLIEQLRSNAGKVRATELALKRGLKVNTKYVDRAREFFTDAGDPEIALSYAMNFEQAERVLASYDPKKRRKIESMVQELHPKEEFLREIFDEINWHDVKSSIRARAYTAIERGEAAEISDANPLPFYKTAVVRFLTLMDFIAAYELAVRKKFPTGNKLSPEQFSIKHSFKYKPKEKLPTKNRIYTLGITFYEAFEEFAKAAQLEALRGDTQRVQLYQTLYKMLKVS